MYVNHHNVQYFFCIYVSFFCGHFTFSMPYLQLTVSVSVCCVLQPWCVQAPWWLSHDKHKLLATVRLYLICSLRCLCLGAFPAFSRARCPTPAAANFHSYSSQLSAESLVRPVDGAKKHLTVEIGWRQSDACGVALPAVNPVQMVHAGCWPVKHPSATKHFYFKPCLSVKTNVFVQMLLLLIEVIALEQQPKLLNVYLKSSMIGNTLLDSGLNVTLSWMACCKCSWVMLKLW